MFFQGLVVAVHGLGLLPLHETGAEVLGHEDVPAGSADRKRLEETEASSLRRLPLRSKVHVCDVTEQLVHVEVAAKEDVFQRGEAFKDEGDE